MTLYVGPKATLHLRFATHSLIPLREGRGQNCRKCCTYKDVLRHSLAQNRQRALLVAHCLPQEDAIVCVHLSIGIGGGGWVGYRNVFCLALKLPPTRRARQPNVNGFVCMVCIVLPALSLPYVCVCVRKWATLACLFQQGPNNPRAKCEPFPTLLQQRRREWCCWKVLLFLQFFSFFRSFLSHTHSYPFCRLQNLQNCSSHDFIDLTQHKLRSRRKEKAPHTCGCASFVSSHCSLAASSGFNGQRERRNNK